jgi:hypothetical protein
MARDTHPETRRSIYLFVARPTGQSREATELILDEEGRQVPLQHLRRHLFAPVTTVVPRAIVGAVTVTIDPPVNHLRLSECDIVNETIT